MRTIKVLICTKNIEDWRDKLTKNLKNTTSSFHHDDGRILYDVSNDLVKITVTNFNGYIRDKKYDFIIVDETIIDRSDYTIITGRDSDSKVIFIHS